MGLPGKGGGGGKIGERPWVSMLGWGIGQRPWVFRLGGAGGGGDRWETICLPSSVKKCEGPCTVQIPNELALNSELAKSRKWWACSIITRVWVSRQFFFYSTSKVRGDLGFRTVFFCWPLVHLFGENGSLLAFCLYSRAYGYHQGGGDR